MGRIEAGGPELPTEPGPPARDDPDAMARLRATFIDGMDGWVDDSFAFGRSWGFELAAISVPIGIWRGTGDINVSAEHADHLLAHIATSQGHVYTGGHLPGTEVYQEIYDWLHVGQEG
jgi:pimeloyl-ACP methyl ester carboxylesterase